MNKKQTQKVNMIDTCMAVLNLPANKLLWTTNNAFNTAVGDITVSMGVLDNSDSIRMTGPIAFTETKGQAKLALIKATMLHASAGKGYGAVVKNEVLRLTCGITESSLIRSADADLGSRCMNVYEAVQPFIGSMGDWSVDATTLVDLQNAITFFANLVGTPQAQISAQNAAVASIDTEVKTITTILINTVDTLMLQFKTTHATFYNAYFSARKIHHTGVRHSTTFTGFVYNANHAVLQYMLVVLLLNGKEIRKHFTDASGHFRFTRLHLGTYTLQVSGEGFEAQAKIFEVTTLQSIEADFLFT